LFSPQGAIFEVTSVYDDLGAYERVEAQREGDDEFQAMVRRVQPALARPSYVELFETLISPAPHGETLPEYRQNVRYYAALGKAGELQSALTDWVQSRAERGTRCALAVHLLLPGPVFNVSTWYADLSHFERARADRRANRDDQAAMARIDSLSDRPVEGALFHILLHAQGGRTLAGVGSAASARV
jgi:hypothetical protein